LLLVVVGVRRGELGETMEKGGDLFQAPERPVGKSKVRVVPDVYFLPRRSIPRTIALYSFLTAAGVGCGMLVEPWIKKQVESKQASPLLSFSSASLSFAAVCKNVYVTTVSNSISLMQMTPPLCGARTIPKPRKPDAALWSLKP
jgi:hypothetical protein